MAGRFSEKCKVTVSEDNMSATLFIEPPEDGIAYSVDELTSYIKSKGIFGGIIFSALEEMTQNNIYYEDHIIARGTEATEGTEGRYEYYFEDVKNRKPLIRSDGSVDYQSMSEIQNISIGEKLIKYYKAVQGKQGVDVRGRSLRPKPCKDLPAIKGTGFSYDEDAGLYTATNEGRIEFDGKTLRISDVYEHRGDLDLVVGKVDCRGDVVIKGNVLSGTYIRATKSITVEGSVEAATLISGGDIILKKGMQGGKKARISCGGNVYANFLEFTQVEAKGNVEANIIMNCQISASRDVVVSGKRGAIVGGNTYSVGFINSTFLGNNAGHRTIASVGVTNAIRERQRVLTTKYNATGNSIEKTKQEIVKVTEIRVANERPEVKAAKISQLKRRLERDERLYTHIKEELNSIEEIMGIGKRAKITISSTVYPGSKIIVDDIGYEVEKQIMCSEFFKDPIDEKVAIRPSS